MNRRIVTSMVCALAALVLVGCSDYKESGGQTAAERQAELEQRAQWTVDQFKNEDPGMAKFFENSVGYAVFPKVAKGGAGIHGAHGNGVLYENGRIVGYADLTQGGIGLTLGGQVYKEIIFFEDAGALREFKRGDTEFSGQASAVAASKGASANADYEDGVAVFTLGEEGLMFEASIGGQEFDYTAKR